jgi:hypothetical protein
MIGILALLGFLWLVLSVSQQAAHGQEHGHAGEIGRFYETWKRPAYRNEATGERVHSCCNKKDCAPTEIVSRNGKLYAWDHPMRPKEYVELPPALFEHNQPDPRESPDGRNHVCMHTIVYCVALGSGT